MPRAASSSWRSAIRFCRELPSIDRLSSDIRRSRSLSSGHLAQIGGFRRPAGGGGCGGGAADAAGAGGSAGVSAGSAGSGAVSITSPESPETEKMPTGGRSEKCHKVQIKGENLDEVDSPVGIGGSSRA